jgi:hypothetical protein
MNREKFTQNGMSQQNYHSELYNDRVTTKGESYTVVTKGRNLRDERQFLMLKTSGLVGNQLVLFV